MANESETVMAVCAEWRDCIEAADPSVYERIAGLVKTTKAQQLAYLARIEAAWRREKSEIEADALAVGGIVEAARHSPGNAAAMREALVELRDAARNFCHQILNSKYNDIMDKYKCRERGFPALLDLRYAIPRANVALAAPPRNCDVGTAEEQIERLYGGETCPSCKSPQMTSDGCACVREGPCALRWAQMPYAAEEGAGE